MGLCAEARWGARREAHGRFSSIKRRVLLTVHKLLKIRVSVLLCLYCLCLVEPEGIRPTCPCIRVLSSRQISRASQTICTQDSDTAGHVIRRRGDCRRVQEAPIVDKHYMGAPTVAAPSAAQLCALHRLRPGVNLEVVINVPLPFETLLATPKRADEWPVI